MRRSAAFYCGRLAAIRDKLKAPQMSLPLPTDRKSAQPAVTARASRRVKVGVFAGLSLLTIIGGVIFYNILESRAASSERLQTRRLLVEMKDLFSALQDAETGQRGFLLTGDEKYLGPFNAGKKAVWSHLAAVERLFRPDRSAKLDIAPVRPLAAAKLAELEKTVSFRREHGLEAALELVRTDEGKKTMDEFRRVMAGLEAELSRTLDEKKGLAVRLAIAPEIGRCLADRRRVEQVLLNLMGNAVNFTEQGEVTLRAKQTATVPIRQEQLPQLFRQFDSGLARQHEGTGLGLAICRKLVALMDGEIQATSEWGQGSVFTVTRPLAGATKL